MVHACGFVRSNVRKSCTKVINVYANYSYYILNPHTEKRNLLCGNSNEVTHYDATAYYYYHYNVLHKTI